MTLLSRRKKKSGSGGTHLSSKRHSKSSSIAIPKLTTKQWPMKLKNKLTISDNSNTMSNGYDIDDQSVDTNHDDDYLVSPPRVQSSAKTLNQLDERRCISTNNNSNNNSRTSSMNTTNAIIEDDSIAQRLMKEDVTGIRLISKRVSLSQFIEKDKIALNEEEDETTASISSNEKSTQSSEESLISKPKSDTSLSRLLTSNPHKNEEGTFYEEEKFCIGKNNTCLEVLSVFIIEPITTCCNIMGYICDPIVSGDIFNMQYCGTTEGGM